MAGRWSDGLILLAGGGTVLFDRPGIVPVHEGPWLAKEASRGHTPVPDLELHLVERAAPSRSPVTCSNQARTDLLEIEGLAAWR